MAVSLFNTEYIVERMKSEKTSDPLLQCVRGFVNIPHNSMKGGGSGYAMKGGGCGYCFLMNGELPGMNWHQIVARDLQFIGR